MTATSRSPPDERSGGRDRVVGEGVVMANPLGGDRGPGLGLHQCPGSLPGPSRLDELQGAGDSTMLVATKLHIPPPPASSMPRRRVTRILQAGLRRRLTLVSAPMGFGKTTVVRDLVSAVDQPCAWLSLNAGDNDPVRFWQYVIAALQTIQPGIGQTAQELLDAPRPPSLETVVTAVINDLVPPGTASAAPPRDDSSPTWLMVLDDYHVIDTASIHARCPFHKFAASHAAARL